MIDIIGVPFSSAGTSSGVACAPAALRRAGLVEQLHQRGMSIRDTGDVEVGPLSTDRDPSAASRHTSRSPR